MKAARAEMLPSGWVTPVRAPGEKSFQSKSGLVREASCRNLFSGWYQPAFQKRFFSTWSEVKKASIPPELAVISTVIFWRAWISGSVSHLTFIPESDSNSGMFFSSTSMKGCLVSIRKSSLPWKRFQLKPCAFAGVKTKGPVAAPAAAAARKARRVRRRAVILGLLSCGRRHCLRRSGVLRGWNRRRERRECRRGTGNRQATVALGGLACRLGLAYVCTE